MGIPIKHLSAGEQVVLHLRTHLKTLFLPFLVLLAVLGAAVAVALLIPGGGGQGWTRLAIGVLALLVGLYVFGRPLLRWWTTTYTVTNRRLITRTGVLTRKGHDIPLSRINDVQIEKGLSDRLFGCGTLLIANASESGGIRLFDVPEVEQVQVQINELLHAADEAGDEPPTARASR